jgi:hypothetical protein
MICPICKESGARRSRRRGIADALVSVAGVYPWRCHHCHGRFHARLMPLSHSFQAHCPVCGNMDLMRISPDYVSGSMSFLWRLLRVPAFRCEPCRHKYFSILPYREVSDEEQNMVSSD